MPNAWKKSGGIFDVADREKEFTELESIAASLGFRDKSDDTGKISARTSQLRAILKPFKKLRNSVDELEMMLKIIEGKEGDAREKALQEATDVVAKAKQMFADEGYIRSDYCTEHEQKQKLPGTLFGARQGTPSVTPPTEEKLLEKETIESLLQKMLEIKRLLIKHDVTTSENKTLYHALIGQPPFDEENQAEIVKDKLNHEKPLLSEIHPDIEKEVEQIIARILKMERSQSHSTYTSILDNLRKVADIPEPQVNKTNKSKKIVIKKKGSTIKAPTSSSSIITSSNKAANSTRLSQISSKGNSTIKVSSSSKRIITSANKTINSKKLNRINSKGNTIKVSPSSRTIITSSNKAASGKTLRPVSSSGNSPGRKLTAEEKSNRKKILLKILWGFLAVIAIIGIITGGVFYKIKKNKELSIKRAQYELGNAIAQARNYNEKIHQKISTIKKLTAKTTEIEQQAVTIAAKLTGESAETIRQEVIPPPPEPKPVASTNNVTASNAVPAKAENSTNAPPATSAPASNITEQAKAPAPEHVKNDSPSIALTKKVFILTAKINEQLEQAQKIGKNADRVLAEAEKSRSKKAAEGILPGLENMQAQLDSISKKIEKMLKKTSSPITELNALFENRKQELEEAKREQELEALRKKQEAELQRKKAEHQAKVNQDLAIIGNADAALKAAVRTQEYDDFIFDLKKKKDRLITKEGRETINKYIDQAIYLRDLKTFLIKQLNKYPYKWGWIESGSPEDIIKAIPRRIILNGRSVTWSNVSPKQYYKIATHYINEQNKNVKLVDLAKNAMGLAIYFNTYGAYERAVEFADKAISWSPRFAKEKARLLPPPPEKDDKNTTTDDENKE